MVSPERPCLEGYNLSTRSNCDRWNLRGDTGRQSGMRSTQVMLMKKGSNFSNEVLPPLTKALDRFSSSFSKAHKQHYGTPLCQWHLRFLIKSTLLLDFQVISGRPRLLLSSSSKPNPLINTLSLFPHKT